MDMDIHISRVTFKAADPEDRAVGLVGWVTCKLNDALVVDGIAVRRTRDGRPTISFPARHDDTGRKHYVLKPVDEVTRRAIERQVLEALGIEGEGGTQ